LVEDDGLGGEGGGSAVREKMSAIQGEGNGKETNMAERIPNDTPPETSVPKPTLIPLSSITATLAVPLLRLKFDEGQCEIPESRALIKSISESERWTQ
jgi:hypothetical protein